jgi:hypothetical protein
VTKRSLKARDIERLENTSVANGLMGHAALVGASNRAQDLLVAHGHNAACDLITCDHVCSTICNTIATTVGGVGTPVHQPPCLPITVVPCVGQTIPPTPCVGNSLPHPGVQSLVCPTKDCGPSFGGGPNPCQ